MARKNNMFSRIQSFDAYAKTLDDFKIKTSAGAIVTLSSFLLVMILIMNEYSNYRKVEMRPELVIDKARMEKMDINIDITFNKAPCVLLGLDMMDNSGEQQINYFQNVQKVRLRADGTVNDKPKVFEKRPKEGESGKDLDKPKCGSCYNGKAPPSGCCNTCEEVHQAYQAAGMAFIEPDSIEQCVEERYVEQIKDQEGEGCRLIGRIRINKVAGNFHIMAGETIKRDKVHMHAMHHYYPQNYDFSHTINTLSFGETFEGQSNPLDKVSKSAPVRDVMYQYFVKVVGTELHYLNNTVLRSNQYSVTEHDNAEDAKNNAALLALLANQKSGFFVVFDISPMRIIYTQYKPSFTSFLSSSLAIIGSIFTVAGILDSFIFRAERAILAKHEIGKLH